MPLHRALQWLHRYGQLYPRAWELYAFFMEKHEEAMRAPPGMRDETWVWPSWCFCPLAGAHTIITQATQEDLRVSELAQLMLPTHDTGALGALAAWRVSQGIYRIDPDLLDDLWETPVTGDIPVEVLHRLPEWAPYIETPGRSFFEVPLYGFWAFLEYDSNLHHAELRLTLDLGPGDVDEPESGLRPLVIHLGGTLEEGIRAADDYTKKNARNQTTVDFYDLVYSRGHSTLSGLVSTVLYLCADETDVPHPDDMPKRLIRRKKRRSLLPCAKSPTVHETGARMGAKLRWLRERYGELPEGGIGQRRQPHGRRAHWHTYWYGPRSGPRTPRAKWLPWMPVGFKGIPEEATIRPVE